MYVNEHDSFTIIIGEKSLIKSSSYIRTRTLVLHREFFVLNLASLYKFPLPCIWCTMEDGQYAAISGYLEEHGT